MILVPDQLVLLYEEDGHVVGAFIGEEVGGHVFLSWSIMSRPGAFPRALAEAVEYVRLQGWPYVEFKIFDNHPRAAALARLALERYGAEAVESDERGVFYRLNLKEARNGRFTPEAEAREGIA